MAKKKPKKKVKVKKSKTPKGKAGRHVGHPTVAKKKKTRKPKGLVPGRGLAIKKIEIMNAVPIMPCSVLGRDRQGLRFAHTQAERVFDQYSRQCRQKGLTIRMIECKMETLPFPFTISEEKVESLLKNLNFTNLWPWTRATCTFEIEDVATGQSETFKGAGLGNNDVWSDTSAQTIAFKQALLLYFFTAWPQPNDHLQVIRESLALVAIEDKVAAFEQLLPKKAWNVMTRAGAVKALLAFYGGKTE